MDWISASDAVRTCEYGDADQCPKERNPIFFTDESLRSTACKDRIEFCRCTPVRSTSLVLRVTSTHVKQSGASLNDRSQVLMGHRGDISLRADESASEERSYPSTI